jgi:hypothetical protein
MTRQVSRENSQDALDKDPRAVRPDQAKQPESLAEISADIARLMKKLDGIDRW